MQPSDVSAYIHLQQSAELQAPKRAEPNVPSAPSGQSRLDTTSVSASARALTFSRQAEVVAQTLTPERLARLRDQEPIAERIAHAIVQSEMDA